MRLSTIFFKLVFIVLLLICSSCKQDGQLDKVTDSISIRLYKDPQKLHPIFSPTAIAREITQYIFLAVADFDPETLELSPILIKSIPDGELKENNLIDYAFEFKDNARWSDGAPVTAYDYLFTIKAILHPSSNATAWRPYFKYLKDVKVDFDNPNKVVATFDASYMLSKETAVTIHVLPEHIYDSQKVLRNISIPNIGTEDNNDEIEKLFQELNASVNEKSNIVQTGPYQLESYETNQYYKLTKKKNYWGENDKSPYLESHYNEMVIKIVGDEVTAATMAKAGEIDVMVMRQSALFDDLREKSGERWEFHVPQLMRYFQLAINNKHPILSDRKVRRSLAHMLDIDDIIESLDSGLGLRTTGPFHPAKPYYDDNLTPIGYDLALANRLLDEAGWTVLSGDQYRSKIINGVKQILELDVLQTGSPLSKGIALLLQDSAEKVGVNINPVTKSSSLMRSENLSDFNFDLALLLVSQDSAPDDPYDRWHSDNAEKGKRNFMGYSNPNADRLIAEIRTSTDSGKRKKLYKDLQHIFYEDQPAVFLYCPLNKIIINKAIDGSSTAKRPGYLANTFKPR